MYKRGEEYEGKAIATIVLIIAFLTVLYLIFIPPESREELLYGEANETTEALEEKEELLVESPGWVTPISEYGTRAEIPSVNLFVKSEPKIKSLATSLDIYNSLFSKSSPTLRFALDDLTDLKKATLFFSVSSPKGILLIEINGNNFFSEKIEYSGVKVIEIPTTYLLKSNVIKLSVSSPGLAFWRTNKYLISDLGIKQEYELINSKESRTFIITEVEKDSAEEVALDYYLYCNTPPRKGIANLRIYLNSKEIFNGEIKCISTVQSLEIDPNLLNIGSNELLFVLDEGDFSLNQMNLEILSSNIRYPSYYFTLSKSQADLINENKKEVILKLILENDRKQKNAKIMINNNAIYMKTKEGEYAHTISSYIDQGTNFLQIEPGNSFNIVGLKVLLI